MDIATGILIQWHRLQQNELSAFSRLLYLNESVEVALAFENVGVTLFAQLAFKLLPVVASHVLPVLFSVLLRVDPRLEALVVDQADRASTFAGEDQRIGIGLLWTPAKTAVYLLFFRSKFETE